MGYTWAEMTLKQREEYVAALEAESVQAELEDCPCDCHCEWFFTVCPYGCECLPLQRPSQATKQAEVSKWE